MNENVVEINNLCKTYKDTKAVAHVNMTIKKGDIYGFIGRNGAGKSTTLKMIVGLIFPTSGQIKLFGESRNKFTDRRIGSLIENPGLYPNLSAYDNMELKAIALGLKDKEKIIELLNLVKLDYKSKKIVKKFSLGMKQRLAIALALLGNPDLLILDEPINGLDPEGIRQIREVIQYLNENKKMTIIISSHILGELSKIATRYGIIRDGQMIEEISELIQKGQAKKVVKLVNEALEAGFPATDILNQGLLKGMDAIGVKFKNEEVFVPEVLVAARAMNKGIEILKPYLQDTEHQSKGTVILGTVKGDLHDIGKNLVKIMLEGKGLEVVDLGVDVDAQKFVEEAKIHQAQIICCSALLTTTMPEMKKVVDLVAQEHLNVKVMIGGAPVNQDYCNEIGADYYTDDATSASEVAYAIVGGTLC